MTGPSVVPQRIPVSGAAGFPGSHLCRRLADEGFKVRALVREGGTAIDFAGRNIESVSGDLRDPATLDRAIAGVDRVDHIGALLRPGGASKQALSGANEHCIGRTVILSNDSPATLNRLLAVIADRLDVPRPGLRLPFTLVYLLSILCEVACKLLRVKTILYRRGVNFFRKQRYFDIIRARTELGFNPRTALQTGFDQTIDWFREYGHL